MVKCIRTRLRLLKKLVKRLEKTESKLIILDIDLAIKNNHNAIKLTRPVFLAIYIGLIRLAI